MNDSFQCMAMSSQLSPKGDGSIFATLSYSETILSLIFLRPEQIKTDSQLGHLNNNKNLLFLWIKDRLTKCFIIYLVPYTFLVFVEENAILLYLYIYDPWMKNCTLFYSLLLQSS